MITIYTRRRIMIISVHYLATLVCCRFRPFVHHLDFIVKLLIDADPISREMGICMLLSDGRLPSATMSMDSVERIISRNLFNRLNGPDSWHIRWETKRCFRGIGHSGWIKSITLIRILTRSAFLQQQKFVFLGGPEDLNIETKIINTTTHAGLCMSCNDFLFVWLQLRKITRH